MGAEAEPSLRPRGMLGRPIAPLGQTAGGAALASMEAVEGCAVSAPPTFDGVLARYQDEIYRYAVHLTRDRADADGLYHETMLEAYRAFDRLEGSANHRAWLYRIATNAFLGDRRKRGREGSRAGETAETTTDAARLDAHDQLPEAEAFLAELPLEQRLALVQRKYHGLSYAEIAANLRCSEAAARASAHAGLRTLRERFEDRRSG